MYEGRSIGFLNRIIESQESFPVEYYFEKADRLFYKRLQGIFCLSLLLSFILTLKLIYQKPSIIIQSTETGVLIGISSIILSNYYEWPAFNSWFTISFINLSLSPFGGNSIMQYRIFVPLIGWITGLKGEFFFILPTLGTLSFLAAANYWGRTFYKDKKTAVLITLLVAFLPAVQFTNVFCWVDTFCYLFLIFLCVYTFHLHVSLLFSSR